MASVDELIHGSATQPASLVLDEPHVSSDVLYEVIDGEIVELPPMGNEQEVTAGVLYVQLDNQAAALGLGRAFMEKLFDFTQQVGHKRRPDVAFVSADRWPRNKPMERGDGWKVVPNLVVEVISPSNTWEEVNGKIDEYFHVGVERVWVVSTMKKQVHVYSSRSDVHILEGDDILTDEDLLPGFRLGLKDLFELVGE